MNPTDGSRSHGDIGAHGHVNEARDVILDLNIRWAASTTAMRTKKSASAPTRSSMRL
jgi:hypothetical protein